MCQVEERAAVDAGGQPRQLVGRDVLGRDEHALLVLELPAYGVVAGLVDERGDQGRVDVDLGALEVRGDAGRVDAVVAHPGQRVRAERARPDQVDHDAAHGEPGGAQLGDPVGGLLHGHLLEDGDEVDGRQRRAQQLHHLVGLRLHRADLGQSRQLGVDPEELADAAGGRRVEHHGVVHDGRGLAALLADPGPLDRLVDLAGQQHVAHTGRDGGGEVDHPEAVERLPGAAELVVHREVLQERGLRVDVQGVHLPGAAVLVRRALGDASLLVGERVDVEHPGDALAALDLAEQHVLARTWRGRGRGRRPRSTCRCRPCRSPRGGGPSASQSRPHSTGAAVHTRTRELWSLPTQWAPSHGR